MKRFLSISLACAIMVLSLTALAASPGHGGGGGGSSRPAVTPRPAGSATPTPVATATPEASPEVTLAPGETATPEPTSGPEVTETPAATEEPGTETPAPTGAPGVNPPVIVTPGGTNEIPTGEYVEVIEMPGGVEGNDDYTDPTGEIPSLNSDGFSEYASYEVIASDKLKDEINGDPDKKVKITVDPGIDPTKEFTVEVNYGDGWYAVSPEDIILNDDGTVTLTLDKIGAVSFFVKNDGTIGTDDGAGRPAKDVPSSEAYYTVDKNVDYTVVSPQTGYLDAWEVSYGIPAALN